MYTKTFYALLHPRMAAYSAAQLNSAANNPQYYAERRR